MPESLSINKEMLEPSVVSIDSKTSSPREVEKVSGNESLHALQHNILARQGAKAASHLPPLQVLFSSVAQVDKIVLSCYRR
jgi:hypothetical protein